MVRHCKDSQAIYHTKDRETPLPTYVGLLLHAETRKKGLVDKLCDLELSISYRVLEISSEMGNNVGERFLAEKVVCPSNLILKLFTTSTVDNIDHNPSSTTATGSLHGTAISLFQHPTKENQGQEQVLVQPPPDQLTSHGIAPLPRQYAEVPPVQLWKTDTSFPSTTVKAEDFHRSNIDLSDENRWLEHVKDVLDNNDQDQIQNICISWAAFHASQTAAVTNIPPDISCLQPLFREEAKSAAMILHAMNTVKSSIEFLNPGQTPVITCDQPLYAIAEKIQWQWLETQGERNFVVVLGGLHIEMTAWRTLGDLLDGSGWTSAITHANVVSSGTADPFLKASHVSRTRHAHQVTACSLHILRGCPCKNRPLDFRPKIKFLQIFCETISPHDKQN